MSQPAIGKRPNRSVSVPAANGTVWVSDHRRATEGIQLRQGSARIRLTAAEVLQIFDATAELLRSPYPLKPTQQGTDQ